MPTVGIVIIGKEILLGQRRDENVLTLTRYLANRGFQIDEVRMIDDEIASIRGALRAMRSDLIVTTGGLGSTRDDRTREAMAAEFRLPLLPNAEMKRHLIEKIRRPLVPRDRAFTRILRGAVSLENPAGHAEGFFIKKGGRIFAALPGVPRELVAILNFSFEAGLAKFFNVKKTERIVLGVAGLRESEIEDQLLDVGAFRRGEVSILPTAELVSLIVPDEKLVSVIEKRLGAAVFTRTGESLEAAVVRRLRDKRGTVSVAESCTGGGLCEMITRVPGASDVFKGGIVAYDNDVKNRLIGVPSATLKKYGAVSTEVALAMASGVKKRIKTDWSIAITGIAGPGGASAKKPVGTVCIAIIGPRVKKSKRYHFKGDRDLVRLRSNRVALNALRLCLS